MSDKEGRITIVLAEPNEREAATARKALSADGLMNVLGVAPDRRALLATVSVLEPDVVVLDWAVAQGDAAALVREVLSECPSSTIVLTVAEAAPGVLSRAIVAGARGFLLKPYRPEELVTIARDAFVNARQLRESGGRRKGADLPEGGALIAVYSPKGGVGTTTIATNLAVALVGRTKGPVAIVDLDLQFGDVGVALDLKSPNSIVDLMARDGDVDATLIEDVLVTHRSGLRVLLAPESLGLAGTLDPERVRKVLGQLREHFAYVVCDTWCSFDDLTVAALSAADRVVLVTTPELPALRNLRRVISELPSLQLERKGLIVANRYPAKVGLGLGEMEKALGKKISLSIPSEGVAITKAINQGLSALDTRARARTSQSFIDLADLVLREVGARQSRGLGEQARSIAS